MPKEDATYLRLRVPPDLRDWLQDHAAQACRSLNAEVLFRLRAVMDRQSKSNVGKRREATAMHAPSA